MCVCVDAGATLAWRLRAARVVLTISASAPPRAIGHTGLPLPTTNYTVLTAFSVQRGIPHKAPNTIAVNARSTNCITFEAVPTHWHRRSGLVPA